MINFQQFETAAGDRIYFQRLPGVKSVCVRLVVFTGAADDVALGAPGVYHWFEHVPFRGTRKYPGGAEDTLNRFDRVGGYVNAHTTTHCTSFYAHVPSIFWKEALDLLVDLVASPLLEDTAIEAERVIIQQEMRQRMSEPDMWTLDQVMPRVLGSHPLGVNVLGTEKSLRDTNASVVRAAYQKGYDRSRCALIMAGDIESSEVVSEFDAQAERLPDHGLTSRHCAASYGRLPPEQLSRGKQASIQSPFSTSQVVILFPIWPERDYVRWTTQWEYLAFLCDGPSSPALNTLREEQQLVYSLDARVHSHQDVGFFQLLAACSVRKSEAVIQAWHELLREQDFVSSEHIHYVKNALHHKRLHMRIPDPERFAQIAEGQVVEMGRTVSDEEWLQLISSFSRDEMVALLESLTPDKAQIFVVKERERRKWFF